MTDIEVPAPEDIIRYEKDPATRIATITIDRPDRMNSPTIGARRRYGDLIFRRGDLDGRGTRRRQPVRACSCRRL